MLCTACGAPLYEGLAAYEASLALCQHHHVPEIPEWSAGNRIMCDFFHRRIVPERVIDTEPFADTVWA